MERTSPRRRHVTGRGGEGNRTPGLFDATEALYQLSYTPEPGGCRIYLRDQRASLRPRFAAQQRLDALADLRGAGAYWFAVRRPGY